MLVTYLDATGRQTVHVAYTLRDLEGASSPAQGTHDNAIQPITLQYRTSAAASWTNVAGTFVADVTTGPDTSAPDQLFSVDLPAAANNAAGLQIRWLSADAAGSDEYVGIDDITISSSPVSSGPGTLSLASATLSTTENAGTYNIVVNRTGGTAGAATVNYVIAAGTATTPADFSGTLSGTLNFADGEGQKTIPVTINQDTIVEGNETFTVTLSGATGATLGTPASATVTIVDDENTGLLAFSAATYSPDEGAGTYNIPINRLGTSTGAITVDYVITPGTASNPADFTGPLSGTVSFANGEVLKFVTITIVQDQSVEGTESLSVALSNPTGGAQLGSPSAATVNILDDDNAGIFSLDASTKTVDEAAGTVSFTVNRTGGSSGPATLNYATANGTATSGSDYTGTTTGTVSFVDGQTTATITIPITDDAVIESDETFTVTLSNPTAGALGTPASATVTITDNDSHGTLSFLPTTYSFGENVGVATFTVVRTGGANGAVSVAYQTVAGTAGSPGDFTATSGTLNFADGQTTATFTVAITNDSVAELNEAFSVVLSSPTGGAIIGTDTANATIVDDDVVIPTGLLINEAFVDPPGTNPPKQFVEIRGTPGASLDNVYLFQIEGDFEQGAGNLDLSIDLSGKTLGSNGLLLITAQTGGWTPQDAATNVLNTPLLDFSSTAITGFEIGSYSFVLVYRNPAGAAVPALQTDFDSDDVKDPTSGLGTLDALPSNFTVLDGFGTTDGSANDVRYVTSLPALTAGGSADAVVRINNALNDPLAFYYGTNSGGSTNTTLTFNASATQRSSNFPVGVGIVTPGAANAGAVADTTPPTVVSTVFNAKVGQKIVVTFSEDVSASIAAGDFTLTRNGGGAASLSVAVSSISADGKTVTLTFANTGGVTPTVLQDGTYTFTARAGQIADAAGNTLAADATATIKFLNADFNVSGAVDFDDLVVLAQKYGTTSGATFEQGDANYDGKVDFDDLVVLAQKYGSVASLSALIAPPVAPPLTPAKPVAKKGDGAVITVPADLLPTPVAVTTTALGTRKTIR